MNRKLGRVWRNLLPLVCKAFQRIPDGIRNWAFGLVALWSASWFLSSGFAQTTTTILTNGPSSNRLNLVFLSEAYTSAQLQQFRVDATNALNAFLARAPFAGYGAWFNAYAIAVSSAQSGSDHPAYAYYRSTYFNSSYDASTDHLITIPPDAFDTNSAHGQGLIDALLQRWAGQPRLPVLLVNDLTPGGSDGSGATAIAYRGAGLIDFLAHEAGHVVANLGDEYTDPNPGFPDTEEPNTTRQTNSIKWAAWINPATPIPTPPTASYASTVGLFEGAHYHATGWYRPRFDCTMNHPTFPDYCEVCRESLIVSLYRAVRPVDSFLPANTNLTINSAQIIRFALDLIDPALLDVRWFTNATPVPGAAGTSFTLSPTLLGTGEHTVTAFVHDATPFVRNDPSNFLTQTITWHLNLTVPELRLDSAALLPNGAFGFRVSGTAAGGFLLEASSDLSHWETISSNTLSAGQYWFTNPPPLTAPAQYYRARTPGP